MKLIFALLAIIGFATGVRAQNPLIRHHYSADPAPFVYNDRMYIFYDRDEGPDWYVMNEWRVISSDDMVNWTDHGDVLPITAFKWADAPSHSAWASQCIERNGKFYWYICVQYKGDWRHTIGVAVSDRPEGPYKDALGKPLVPVIEGGQIDPTVFIDDDGQAYLYYGNNLLRYVKLNENMISYDTSIGNKGIVSVELTKEAFGGVKKERTKADGSKETYIDGVDAYEEGPWLHKYNGKYYLSYAAGGVPEHMSYSMSDKPTGPWKYMGKIMPTKNTGSFTNHGGVVEFRGHHYVAYHSAWLPGGSGFRRSACLEEFTYNADGSIPEVTESKKGVKPLSTLNPYAPQEAETMNTGTGLWVYTKPDPRTIYVGDIDKLDTLRVRNADFGDGAAAFTAYVSSTCSTGYIEVYADKVNTTKLLARVPVAYTGSGENWQPVTVPVTREVKGVHDIVFRFNCTSTKEKTNTFTFDRWQFAPKSESRTLVGIHASIDKTVIDKVEEYDNQAKLSVAAVYSDGTEEDVTASADVTFNEEGLVSREGETLTGVGYGHAVVKVSYEGMSTERYLTVRSYFDENAVGSIRLAGDQLKDGKCTLLCGSTKNITATAVYLDGHEADVTSTANFACAQSDIVRNSRGKLTALKDGDALMTVAYQGKLGDMQAADVILQVRSFPLVSELMNLSLSGTCTFTQSSQLLKVSKNGLAGWTYASPIDLRAFDYLVIRLKRSCSYKPTFRLYDSSDINAAFYSVDIAKETEVAVPLKDLVKTDGTPLNLAKIRMAGFSLGAAGSISLADIILTNDDPTGMDKLPEAEAAPEHASTDALYDLQGRPLSQVQRRGLYISKGKKVLMNKN